MLAFTVQGSLELFRRPCRLSPHTVLLHVAEAAEVQGTLFMVALSWTESRILFAYFVVESRISVYI